LKTAVGTEINVTELTTVAMIDVETAHHGNPPPALKKSFRLFIPPDNLCPMTVTNPKNENRIKKLSNVREVFSTYKILI
jgi:hypothetical protein